MQNDNQKITKEEKQWLEEAETDIPVEELALSRTEPESKIEKLGKKIMGEADTINLIVISCLAFLIAIFLTVISFSEESPMLLALTLVFYTIGFIFTVNWIQRLRNQTVD